MTPGIAPRIILYVGFVTTALSLEWRLYAVRHTGEFTYGSLLYESNTKTLVGCCGLCSSVSNCHSVLYHSQTMSCHLNSGTAPLTSLPVSNGWRYAELENPSTSSVTLATTCSTSTDCPIVSSKCDTSTGFCKCDPGYSFHSPTGQCVTACTSYGTTFQPDLGRGLSGYGPVTLSSTTLDDCKIACINVNNCRVIEYKPNTSECQLYYQTALELSSNYGSYGSVDLYQRDCAPDSEILP